MSLRAPAFLLLLFAHLLLFAGCGSAVAAGAKGLLGTWEAARSPQGERLYVRLMHKGKAEVVAEYDFQLPGQSATRRGRSTTFASWTAKGDEVTIAYAKVRDRLRYRRKLSLAGIGLEGAAPALQPVGAPDAKSRLGGVTLWRAPHDYQLKAPAHAAAAPAAAPRK
jgi:hypothetical protein